MFLKFWLNSKIQLILFVIFQFTSNSTILRMSYMKKYISYFFLGDNFSLQKNHVFFLLMFFFVAVSKSISRIHWSFWKSKRHERILKVSKFKENFHENFVPNKKESKFRYKSSTYNDGWKNNWKYAEINKWVNWKNMWCVDNITFKNGRTCDITKQICTKGNRHKIYSWKLHKKFRVTVSKKWLILVPQRKFCKFQTKKTQPGLELNQQPLALTTGVLEGPPEGGRPRRTRRGLDDWVTEPQEFVVKKTEWKGGKKTRKKWWENADITR